MVGPGRLARTPMSRVVKMRATRSLLGFFLAILNYQEKVCVCEGLISNGNLYKFIVEYGGETRKTVTAQFKQDKTVCIIVW